MRGWAAFYESLGASKEKSVELAHAMGVTYFIELGKEGRLALGQSPVGYRSPDESEDNGGIPF